MGKPSSGKQIIINVCITFTDRIVVDTVLILNRTKLKEMSTLAH